MPVVTYVMRFDTESGKLAVESVLSSSGNLHANTTTEPGRREIA